eukprot:m.63601 g.63601  ORF g.63601 m.63601 type:complete len:179 (+) comp13973_c0_seq2:1519-2055(+)
MNHLPVTRKSATTILAHLCFTKGSGVNMMVIEQLPCKLIMICGANRYKYWSCCPKKKTFEFDEFLDFKGCTVGKHRWVKPLEEQAKAKKCRHDWFQSDTHVVLTIFAKCIQPEHASVKANSDSITVNILYQQSFSYTLKLHLGGKIKPEESSVQLMSSKMDIKLAKEPGESWEALSAD